MKLFTFIFFLAMTTTQLSALLPETDCILIKNKIDRTCNEALIESSCTNLKRCQEIRHACPQPKDTVAGCTDFASCLEEKAESENTSYFCSYKWTGQPNAGTCYLKNQRTDSFSFRCPGFQNRFDHYRDAQFTCEGHRLRAISNIEECQRAVSELQVHCPLVNSGISPELLNCQETRLSISPIDSEVSPLASHSGSRDSGYVQPKEEGLHDSYNRNSTGYSATR